MTYQVPQAATGYTGLEFVLYQHDAPLTTQWLNVTKSTINGYHTLGRSYKTLQHKTGVSYGFKKLFQTPNYSATTENTRCVRLAPNKKILIEYQFIMTHMDTTPTLYIDWSFGFNNEGSDSSYFKDKADSSNTFTAATLHYKNYNRNGAESSYRSSIGQAIISHSESGDRNICIHVNSSSDYNNSALRSTLGTHSSYSSSLGSWFKITQLD